MRYIKSKVVHLIKGYNDKYSKFGIGQGVSFTLNNETLGGCIYQITPDLDSFLYRIRTPDDKYLNIYELSEFMLTEDNRLNRRHMVDLSNRCMYPLGSIVEFKHKQYVLLGEVVGHKKKKYTIDMIVAIKRMCPDICNAVAYTCAIKDVISYSKKQYMPMLSYKVDR